MYDSLIGKYVTHNIKGHGVIVDHTSSINIDKDYIVVKYDDTTQSDSKFVYPDITEQMIKFDDDLDQLLAKNRIEAIRAKIILDKEEAIRIKEEEELKKLEEQKYRTSVENKKLYIAKQKKHFDEKRLVEPYPTWLVFQGKSYQEESAEQCIRVTDIKNDNGYEMPFWATITELKIDDVVIHCRGKYIYAISQVVIPIYETYKHTDEYRVECDYTMLNNLIDLDDYREQIIDYHQEYKSPFNKNGKGNQGYLYPLDYDLARFFIIEAAKTNNLTQSYIQDIINTKT